MKAANQLQQRIAVDWDCDYFVGNVGIQEIFTKIRKQEVLQNIHFANNTKKTKLIRAIRLF